MSSMIDFASSSNIIYTFDEYSQIPDEIKRTSLSITSYPDKKTKATNLLEYLNNQRNEYLLSIIIKENKKNFEEIISNINDILLSNQVVQNLYSKNLLNSTDFKNHIKNFTEFVLELKYPSESFDGIYKQLLNLDEKIIISVFISKTDEKFVNDKNIEIVNFDTTVTSIGNYAFSGCTSLRKVTIPTTVKQIGDHCFEGCTKLSRLGVDPFCTQIGPNSFNNCPRLNELTIPTTEKSHRSKSNEKYLIPPHMTKFLCKTNFFSLPEIESLIEDSSEFKIEIEYPSSNFSSIFYEVAEAKRSHPTKIKVCAVYTRNGPDRFFYYEIDIVRFDPKIQEIPDCESDNQSLFEGWEIAEVIIPSSVTRIGKRAFLKCKMKRIRFEEPSSLKEIDEYAFYDCSSLTQITIPSSVTSIDDFAFCNCTSLKQITIPSSVTSIGNCTFSGCSSVEQVTIPSSVTSMGGYAFNACSSLKQITIPSSITSIGDCTFSHCSSFEQITIPSSVTSIGGHAFSSCSSLKQITIPSSVTSIYQYAFCDCSSLAQITIPSSVTLIGTGVFYDCSSLKQITIPSKINVSDLCINSNATINRI